VNSFEMHVSTQQTSFEQSAENETWRDQMFDRLHERYGAVSANMHSEAGSIEGAVAVRLLKLGCLVVTGAVLTGLAVLHTTVEDRETLSSKGGVIKAVYLLPANVCHGGVDARLNAKTEVNKLFHVVGLTIPSTARASETLNDDLTAQVCNTGKAQGERILDPKNHHVTVNIPSEAFTTVVYQTDPSNKNAWTSDYGIASMIQQNFGNFVKTLPAGLDYKGGDVKTNVLRGETLLYASEIMSKACVPNAWPTLKPGYAEEVRKDIVETNNNSLGATKITEADVTVNLPDTIMPNNQYTEKFNGLRKDAEAKGVKFTGTDPAKVPCVNNGTKLDSSRTESATP
jgi:hypothetical protein